MTIHVVVGPPCGGKSTFVATNAAAGVPRFDFDLVASTVAGGDIKHDAPQPVMDTVMAMRRGLFGWLLDVETQIDEVWVINASPSADTIQRFKANGAVFHVVDPGMEECLARAQREGRPASTEQRIRDWYESPPQVDEQKGGDMQTKNFHVEVKAYGAEEGTMEAYAAVFDNIDSYGDVIRKGAFAESLKEWEESGNVIPLLYGHDFNDPFSNIGAVTEAVEDDHGLRITARFDLDNAKAAQVYKLVKEKRLTQMSFAFNVLEAGEIELDGQHAYELRKVKLYETSVVPIGANQETEILAVKHAAGVLSTAVKQAGGRDTATRDVLVKAMSEIAEALAPPDADDAESDPEADEAEGFFHARKGISPGCVNSLAARIMILERNS